MNLDYGSTLDGMNILTSDNHKLHEEHTLLTPITKTVNVTSGDYVQVFKTIIPTTGEGYREFYEFNVVNVGSGQTKSPEYYKIWLRITRYDTITFVSGIDVINDSIMKPIVKIVKKVVDDNTEISVFIKHQTSGFGDILVQPLLVYPNKCIYNFPYNGLVLNETDFNSYVESCETIDLIDNSKIFGTFTVNGNSTFNGISYFNNTIRSTTHNTVDIGTDATRFKNIYGKDFIGTSLNVSSTISSSSGTIKDSLNIPAKFTKPTPPDGDTTVNIVYDKTLNKLCFYFNGNWYGIEATQI